jgi:hypothetical protein
MPLMKNGSALGVRVLDSVLLASLFGVGGGFGLLTLLQNLFEGLFCLGWLRVYFV